MIFESHAHYDDDAFNEDREQLLNSMKENRVYSKCWIKYENLCTNTGIN